MGIVRLLIIGAGVWIAFRLYRYLANRATISDSRTGSRSSKNMVQCKSCGLHIPIDEALLKNDDHYCCSEHRDQEIS